MQDLYLSGEDTHLIRSFAGEAEKAGQLSRQQLTLAFNKGWFKILVPVYAGGAGLSLPQAMLLLESAGRADGSFGWTLNLGAGANMFAGFLDTDTAIRLFADRFITIAGSGALSGTAVILDGGYLINGSWKYATGSAHAKFFSVSCIVTKENEALIESDETSRIRSFLIPKAQVTLTGSWTGYGMKATSTRDYTITDVWIPDELSFSLTEPVSQDPLYKFPFIPLAEALLSATLTGIALHFVEEVSENLRGGTQTTGEVELSRSKNLITESSAALRRTVSRVWHLLESGEVPAVQDYAEISRRSKSAAQLCRMEAARVYPLAGMAVLENNSSINRAWRDLHTASQHTLLSPFS